MSDDSPSMATPDDHSGAEPRLGGPAAIPHLVATIRASTVHDRWAAAFRLEGFGVEAIPAGHTLIGDENPAVRAVGAWLLGQVGADNEIDTLATLLNDNEKALPGIANQGSVADQARAALKRIGTTRALELLEPSENAE